MYAAPTGRRPRRPRAASPAGSGGARPTASTVERTLHTPRPPRTGRWRAGASPGRSTRFRSPLVALFGIGPRFGVSNDCVVNFVRPEREIVMIVLTVTVGDTGRPSVTKRKSAQNYVA